MPDLEPVDPHVRAVLRQVVIMKMRRLRRYKSRLWPVRSRYW